MSNIFGFGSSGGYKPGDIIINVLSLTSTKGFLDLTTMFASFRVYESIFNPNAIMEIDVLDVNDSLGQLNIVGGETVVANFGAPGGVMANYNMVVNTIEDSQPTGATKAKFYTLHCTGQETLQSKANFVQKAYQTDIGSIVQDIHTNYLKSQKPLIVEGTSGSQNIMISNKPPFEAIDMVRRRAVSQQNQSSTYVYFENAMGMNFSTMEGMQTQGAIKSFVHLDTVGQSIYDTLSMNNIIGYEVPQIASATDRIELGGLNQQVSTYNLRTRSYQTVSFTPPPSLFNTAAFIATYGGSYGRFSFIPVDTANRPFTSIDSMTPHQLSYLSNMTQNQVRIRVNGDAIVKAGDMINLNIPEFMNVTGVVPNDPQISGNYLVTRLCRNVAQSQEHPRYTDSIECMSGTMPGQTS